MVEAKITMREDRLCVNVIVSDDHDSRFSEKSNRMMNMKRTPTEILVFTLPPACRLYIACGPTSF